MFQTKVVEKIKTQILCSINFSEKCAIYEKMQKTWYSQTRQISQYNSAHALGMLDD